MDLLLIIRGLAAIAVVIWHAGGWEGGMPLVNIPGRTAVWIFFGISGYVIAYGFINGRYALSRTGLRYFYVNRLLRIYPLFLLLSVLGWLTIWTSTRINPVGWSDVASQFLAFQFNHEYRLNGVFWTLGLEIQFYLLAPLLILPMTIESAAKRRTAMAIFYFSCVGFNEFAIRALGWSVDERNIIAVLPHFFAGMVGCSLVSLSRLPKISTWKWLIAALVLLIFSNWLYHTQPAMFWSFRGVVLVDAMVMCLIFAHANVQHAVVKDSNLTGTLVYLGVLSYGIYAWHAYVMESAPWLATRWWALLIVSIGLASLSYRLVELPALRLKRWQKSKNIGGERSKSPLAKLG